MLHHHQSYRSLNSFVQVFISSLDVILSVSSQLDTYIALLKCNIGGTLSVNAFEFWHARCPSEVARLVKNFISVRLYRRPIYTSLFTIEMVAQFI